MQQTGFALMRTRGFTRLFLAALWLSLAVAPVAAAYASCTITPPLPKCDITLSVPLGVREKKLELVEVPMENVGVKTICIPVPPGPSAFSTLAIRGAAHYDFSCADVRALLYTPDGDLAASSFNGDPIIELFTGSNPQPGLWKFVFTATFSGGPKCTAYDFGIQW